MSSNSSVDYYNSHAEAFIDSSINADVSLLYNEFEKLLKDGSYILDLGCGSGRDSKHFLEKGYKVFVQAMVSLNYNDNEFLELIKQVNEIEPYCFYIVDSFGAMKKRELLRLFYLVDNNLKENF